MTLQQWPLLGFDHRDPILSREAFEELEKGSLEIATLVPWPTHTASAQLTSSQISTRSNGDISKGRLVFADALETPRLASRLIFVTTAILSMLLKPLGHVKLQASPLTAFLALLSEGLTCLLCLCSSGLMMLVWQQPLHAIAAATTMQISSGCMSRSSGIHKSYLPTYGAVGGTHKAGQPDDGEEHCNGYILEDANASCLVLICWSGCNIGR